MSSWRNRGANGISPASSAAEQCSPACLKDHHTLNDGEWQVTSCTCTPGRGAAGVPDWLRPVRERDAVLQPAGLLAPMRCNLTWYGQNCASFQCLEIPGPTLLTSFGPHAGQHPPAEAGPKGAGTSARRGCAAGSGRSSARRRRRWHSRRCRHGWRHRHGRLGVCGAARRRAAAAAGTAGVFTARAP